MERQKPKGWHREDIKAALRKQHGSLEHLSTRWGYHKSTVAIAIAGKSYLPEVERRIARELKQLEHTLWPDRWTPEGTPRSRADRKLSPPRLDTHRPIERAA